MLTLSVVCYRGILVDMDSAFELPIHISYRPPSWLAIALIINHIGAIICIFIVAVPVWVAAIITTAVMAGLIRSLSGYLHDRRVLPARQLILNSSNQWRLVDAHGDRRIRLLPGAFVHEQLLVLRFQDDRRRVSFILSPASVNRDVLRRLRVRLRFANKSEV